MSTYSEKKKEQNRIAQEKYRNSERGKAYFQKYREEHRDEYNKYHLDYYHKNKKK